MNIFKGTGVALITPFRKDGSVDFKALGELINHVSKGVDFLVALGTTAEAAVLSCDEKNAVLNFIAENNTKKLPVVVGVGGNNTENVVNDILKLDKSIVSGILSVTPYYNKPSQRGLLKHYKAIASSTDLPIILYNVPGRTGVNLKAETTLQLAKDFDNIVAVKEASGDLNQIMEIIANKPKEFSVLSGDDALTMAMMAIGADGVISVVANAYPKEFSKMLTAVEKGNLSEAKKIHYKLLAFMNLIFEEGNPGGIKAALAVKGIVSNYLRLPLCPVSRALYNKISDFVK